MTNITLTNASRSVTLDFVIGYNITKKTSYPVKRVPNKSHAIVDFDTKTTDPRTYNVNALITDTDLTNLLTLEADRLPITLNDGTRSDTVYLNSAVFPHRVGDQNRPWLATLTLIASAN